mmetsp:Transcript_21336/g.29685  ORF Transcript_21336/g.29685 Transcript_21336/m.29685 type:complete len:309 (-) Transcript_21336:138-1064(-)
MKLSTAFSVLTSLLVAGEIQSFTAVPSSQSQVPTFLAASTANNLENENHNNNLQFVSRRNVFELVSATAAANAAVALSTAAPANAATGANDGLLPDLPVSAVKDYLQYRVLLQISADFYVWELQKNVGDIDNWGEVGQLFQVNNNKGQGNPSRIEREFTNTMRIFSLSMPPDIAEEMRDTQFKFEKAMAKISKATAGIRRDLPVEIDRSLVYTAKDGWEEGRVALNEFFAQLNAATGLNEMRLIPPPGPDQSSQYGRSKLRYFELVKKTKLCQNRGGPSLSQAWGQLMISGYMQDSCGIPDLEGYFYQ